MLDERSPGVVGSNRLHGEPGHSAISKKKQFIWAKGYRDYPSSGQLVFSPTYTMHTPNIVISLIVNSQPSILGFRSDHDVHISNLTSIYIPVNP